MALQLDQRVFHSFPGEVDGESDTGRSNGQSKTEVGIIKYRNRVIVIILWQ